MSVAPEPPEEILPSSQCETCRTILKKYAKMLGYTPEDVDRILPWHKPRKSWVTKGKGGSRMITHYFKCLRCSPFTKKGWKLTDRSMDVREIGQAVILRRGKTHEENESKKNQ